MSEVGWKKGHTPLFALALDVRSGVCPFFHPFFHELTRNEHGVGGKDPDGHKFGVPGRANTVDLTQKKRKFHSRRYPK
jgi:hypothetical protein